MSRQPDYDRAVERLLRLSLPEGPVDGTPACVDAERLAAWSDGALAPPERASIETHIASCGRCLAMLRVLADTESAVASPAEERSWWQSPMRWLVPISTAAAVVLIWMVLPSRPPEQQAFAPTTQVARDEIVPAAPEQQRSDAPPPPPPAATPVPAEMQSKAAPPSTDQERRRQTTAVQQPFRVAEEPAAKATDTFAAAGQRAANESVMSDRAAAPAAVPAAPAPPAPTARSEAALMMRAEIGPIEIPSPDPARRWRILGRVVERSTNGGASWQAAVVPAGVVVTAGTSPASNICWLVGPNGIVLRTTDGARFEAVSIPEAGALVSVQATDANQARVTSAAGRSYSTTDGGKTWN